MNSKSKRYLWSVIIGVVTLLALALRTAGLFRGLADGIYFHPDSMKQVDAVANYLDFRYVWYNNLPDYDGYPLALNHLDEWLLRPIFVILGRAQNYIAFGGGEFAPRDRYHLYYWVLCLRVVYSLLGLGLLYWIVRRLFPTTAKPATIAVLFLALAPLSVAVAHFATGDIGADLFVALALLLLCVASARGTHFWLAAAGGVVGIAFACKYQGALAMAPLAVYALLGHRHIFRRGFAILTQGLAVVFGFAAGAVIATPALLINPTRTLRDMLNFWLWIQHYQVTPEFAARSHLAQVWLGIQMNAYAITAALGLSLTLAALVGVAIAAMDYRSARRTATGCPVDPHAMHAPALAVAICSFPFLALLISLGGKPEIHPFHVSFLQLPLTIAAVYALTKLWQSGITWRRLAAGLFFAAIVAEMGTKASGECYFWRREDTQKFSFGFMQDVFGRQNDHYFPGGDIKSLALGPSGVSVFRNRIGLISMPRKYAALWQRLSVTPLPAIPLSSDHDWIFMNGPVFPRDDRSFAVQTDTTAAKNVVFHHPPGTVSLGLRAGSLPVKIALQFGGLRRQQLLTPHSQAILALRPDHWRTVKGAKRGSPEVNIVPLQVSAEGGAAWVTVMAGPKEMANYCLFGGDFSAGDVPDIDQQTRGELVEFIRQTPYLESGAMSPVILPNDSTPFAMTPPDMALPAGCYRMECDFTRLTNVAQIVFTVTDGVDYPPLSQTSETYSLTSDVSRIAFVFKKTFAPFECRVEVRCLKGACRLTGWRLRLCADTILDQLSAVAKGGARDWLRQYPETDGADAVLAKPLLRFGNSIELVTLKLPASITQHAPVRIRCGMRMLKIPFRHVEEYLVSFDLMDRQQQIAHSFSVPLKHTLVRPEAPMELVEPTDQSVTIPPGEYRIAISIRNIRTLQCLPVSGNGISADDRERRRVIIGSVHVGAPKG